ncbi:MAG: 30S ribosomal protein S12 methylthiotransferase RimO [Bacteroidaceae bacterium]|nr:30S ribosomal protein S12 methylthiotransferase RimO [Bacteroidaceae bacterium]
MIKNRIDVITLGCSKNLVDSEKLMKQLEALGYAVVHNPDKVKGEIVVINTCGFIGDAKEESVNMILEVCEQKTLRHVKKVYVMGCLSERFFKELNEEIPEVDRYFGKFNWTELVDELRKDNNSAVQQEGIERVLTTPSHYAYVKIGEGCNRMCAYCAIPLITGHHISRPMEEILDEVRWLVGKGVKEVQLIAQDLTYYGRDLYHNPSIAELTERIADIPGVEWLRLHYAYPTDFPFDLLKVIRERPNVCNYLDIALQHISNPVLTRMRRHITAEETYDLLAAIRCEVPGIFLRSTMMVGFPGETEEDFEQLKEFVRKARFERMGAFAYSEEEGTYAAKHYDDDIPDDIKQSRLDELMSIQQEIAEEISLSMIGRKERIIVDREEGDFYIGRTQYDSPEVDPEVLIQKNDKVLKTGQFYDVTITDADEFDLYAKTI